MKASRVTAVFLSILFTLSALAFSDSSVALGEELQVGARVDKAKVAVGEPFTFSVTISGQIKETPQIRLNTFEGFQVISTGQSQQVQMGGGQMQLTMTLNYLLAPLAAGKHTLGPIKVEYQGQEYETKPIEITVVRGASSREPSPERKPTRMPPLEGGVIL